MDANVLPTFGRDNAKIQIQSVMFNNTINDIACCIRALARAAELAIASQSVNRLVLRLGDSSPFPLLDPDNLARMRETARGLIRVEYDFFGSNLGSAAGHNRLASWAEADIDFLWIQNPDVVVAPRTFELVLLPFRHAGVGQVEAKQLPIEHPKQYNPTTGETAWATTACAMIPMPVFKALEGFDSNSFFLYCDDVDFSFRVREAGFKVLYQPSAACFHDKRLTNDASWESGWSEQYYSAEAGLMMAHKWSRPDIVGRTLDYFLASGKPVLEKAAQTFLHRQTAGTLPEPRDPEAKVAEFHGHFYAEHRYAL